MEKTDIKEIKRDGFSSSLAVFFAALSSAIGLGNIWKFPYLVGSNGGGAFLLVYLLCVVFIGIPIMLSEFYIGRKNKKNAVGAFEKMKPKSKWKLIAISGIVSSTLIMFFYSCVTGWVYLYIIKAIKGDFASVTTESVKTIFTSSITNPWQPIVFQIIVLAIVSAVLISGVKNGIEKITKILMPVLFVLIIVCDIKSLTLPGASEGLKFLFSVKFSDLTAAAILTALGLAFFKLSLGMGTMITYGSYFTDDNNMVNTAVKVSFADTLVSLLAGLAIFPAVFTYHVAPGAGPGLLFMSIPLVFSQMPFGNILLIIFFVLTAIAATASMLSLVEVSVAFWSEEKKLHRTKAVLLTTGIIAVLGTLATLSADPHGILGNVKILGQTFFEFFDFLSSNILLPTGGLFISIFIGYFTKKEDLKTEISNHGQLKKILPIIDVFYFVIRYITPVLLSIVFVNKIIALLK